MQFNVELQARHPFEHGIHAFIPPIEKNPISHWEQTPLLFPNPSEQFWHDPFWSHVMHPVPQLLQLFIPPGEKVLFKHSEQIPLLRPKFIGQVKQAVPLLHVEQFVAQF
jgi:hypothetical protein